MTVWMIIDKVFSSDLKHAIGTNVSVLTTEKLKLVAAEHMATIEQLPERTKRFVQDPRVKYAA